MPAKDYNYYASLLTMMLGFSVLFGASYSVRYARFALPGLFDCRLKLLILQVDLQVDFSNLQVGSSDFAGWLRENM